MDGESEVPHPELARTGGGQGIQPPVSGLRKERWVEKGGHGWGWFSAGMVLRGKCRKNCLPRVSQTRLWGQQPFRPSLVGILGSLLVTGRLTVLPCSKLPQVRLRSLGWMDWEDRGLAAMATSPQETHPLRSIHHGAFET